MHHMRNHANHRRNAETWKGLNPRASPRPVKVGEGIMSEKRNYYILIEEYPRYPEIEKSHIHWTVKARFWLAGALGCIHLGYIFFRLIHTQSNTKPQRENPPSPSSTFPPWSYASIPAPCPPPYEPSFCVPPGRIVFRLEGTPVPVSSAQIYAQYCSTVSSRFTGCFRARMLPSDCSKLIRNECRARP